MALDIPEEKVSPVVYGLNSDDYHIPMAARPAKQSSFNRFCESTFKNSDLSKGNAWFPQVAMHTLYCFEAKKALKGSGRARITQRQRPRPLPDLCCARRGALKEE
jgi:hypothetical protein